MKHREEGFVLVAMIWIVAILAVITLGFAHRALLDQRAAALALDHSKAQYMARGAVNYAVADMRNKAYVDGLIERARVQLTDVAQANAPIGETVRPLRKSPNLLAGGSSFSTANAGDDNTASYSVADQEGHISVNTAPEELLDNIDALGMRTVSAIMRRRDTEEAPEEREQFLAIEEIRLLDDINEEDWLGDEDTPGLRDLFTVYGDGKINVNTAPREVLVAIPDIDESTVDRIVGFRQGDDAKLGTEDDRYFPSLEAMSRQLEIDPTSLAPLAKYCTFESHFFTITGFAALRQGKVRASAQAVVHMQPGSAAVLTWSEGELGPQDAY
jgi:general secretion pathway protein K